MGEPEFEKALEWVHEKSRKSRAFRDKVHRAYIQYVSDGKTPDATYPILVERFGDEFQSVAGRELTRKVVDNIVNRPTGGVADSLTQAVLVTKLQKLADSCEEQIDEINDLLDGTDGEDFNGFVAVSEEETTGGKFAGVKTKRIPLSEYRQQLMERRHHAHLAFFEAVKSLLPRDKVNILVNGGDVSVLADEDLDRQLRQFDKRRTESVSEV